MPCGGRSFAKAVAPHLNTRALVLCEIVTIWTVVQAFIWRWQYSRPKVVWMILAFLAASHAFRRETPKVLGFRWDNWRQAIGDTLWAGAPFLLLFLLIGILSGRIWDLPLRSESVVPALRYTLWGMFQQYGLQGYFHRRLMCVISHRLWSSLIIAFVFMSFHTPNPVLMVFTLLGGFAFSVLYTRSPNLLVLGVFHGALGLLLSNVFPRDWLHNMRVGPGYYR